MVPSNKIEESLFKIRLDKMLNLDHPLCRLAKTIDWPEFDKEFTPLFCPDNGRPGIPTRMMVALHYLKYSEDLSDEEVVEKWIQNPYWQYFCGGEYFERISAGQRVGAQSRRESSSTFLWNGGFANRSAALTTF